MNRVVFDVNLESAVKDVFHRDEVGRGKQVAVIEREGNVSSNVDVGVLRVEVQVNVVGLPFVNPAFRFRKSGCRASFVRGRNDHVNASAFDNGLIGALRAVQSRVRVAVFRPAGKVLFRIENSSTSFAHIAHDGREFDGNRRGCRERRRILVRQRSQVRVRVFVDVSIRRCNVQNAERNGGMIFVPFAHFQNGSQRR